MNDLGQRIGARSPSPTFAIVACVVSFVLVLVASVVTARFERIFQELGIPLPGYTEFFISAHRQHLESIPMLVIAAIFSFAMRKPDRHSRVMVPGMVLGLTLLTSLLFTIAMLRPLIVLVEVIDQSPPPAGQR